jgi:hypothetical protein
MAKDKRQLWTPKSLYQFWNCRYFHGRLPNIPVYFSKKLGVGQHRHSMGCSSFDDETLRPLRICLNPRYKDAFVVWASTLLHEMVHIEQYKIQKTQAHGRKFRKRMKQLVSLGAYNPFL